MTAFIIMLRDVTMLVSKGLPFRQPQEIFDNILDRRIQWPPEDEMSPECRDLIDRLLTIDIYQRLGHRGAGEVRATWGCRRCVKASDRHGPPKGGKQ